MTDMCKETGRSHSVADFIARAFSAVVQIASHVKREQEIRRAQRHLKAVSDDVLKDIGMHRSEIHAVSRLGRKEYSRRNL